MIREVSGKINGLFIMICNRSYRNKLFRHFSIGLVRRFFNLFKKALMRIGDEGTRHSILLYACKAPGYKAWVTNSAYDRPMRQGTSVPDHAYRVWVRHLAQD